MELGQMLLAVCPLVFFAAVVDAIAGGGGLISLPAYLLTGMPAHMAYGSNKFSACIGTLFSALRFLKNGSLNLKIALFSAIFALLGSASGARLTLVLDDKALRISMLILLPFTAIFVLFNKNAFNDQSAFARLSAKRALFLAAVIGFALGLYDGFFGPGTGTFLILAYSMVMGFDFKTACGNTKIVNLASNTAALIVFILAGQVMYVIAIPAVICSIAGNWLGSGLAIHKGAKFIRPVLIGVLLLLFIKIIYDTVGLF